MLKPAILYKNEILTKIQEYNYTEDMMYYSGYLGNAIPSIEEDTNGKLYQYAIVDDGKLIGYFTYQIDWYSSSVYNFGLFSFDRNNVTIGIDVYRELKKIGIKKTEKNISSDLLASFGRQLTREDISPADTQSISDNWMYYTKGSGRWEDEIQKNIRKKQKRENQTYRMWISFLKNICKLAKCG